MQSNLFARPQRFLAVLLLGLPGILCAQSPTLTIDAGRIVKPVSPTLYGLMTEEINHSYDGGLYAEMVRNRTFTHDWMGVPYWMLDNASDAQATLKWDETDGPSEALQSSVIIDATKASGTTARPCMAIARFERIIVERRLALPSRDSWAPSTFSKCSSSSWKSFTISTARPAVPAMPRATQACARPYPNDAI